LIAYASSQRATARLGSESRSYITSILRQQPEHAGKTITKGKKLLTEANKPPGRSRDPQAK
jgi:hypothetical protein